MLTFTDKLCTGPQVIGFHISLKLAGMPVCIFKHCTVFIMLISPS